jgi:hypothetical protein
MSGAEGSLHESFSELRWQDRSSIGKPEWGLGLTEARIGKVDEEKKECVARELLERRSVIPIRNGLRYILKRNL